MEKFSNQLTDAELERLAFLSEELGEAQQAVGKILRHGYESYNPIVDTGMTNRRELERELGDINAAIFMLVQAKDVSGTAVYKRSDQKVEGVKRWLHHQEVESV
jgi:NTP pyrophosphatase (non-canonical NTP hydrolase)